ncbi:hypothetical protein SHPE106448_04385 [Shewanella pealeana]
MLFILAGINGCLFLLTANLYLSTIMSTPLHLYLGERLSVELG